MGKIVAAIVVVLLLVSGGIAFYINMDSTYKNPSKSPSPMTNMPASSSDQSSSTAKATNTVTIDNFAYSPAAITIKKGTTVTWTNQDSTVHTVTETDGQNGPKSDNLETGKSYSFTFTKTGTFKYGCLIHSGMKGTVTVTE